MIDTVSPQTRSRMMSQIRSTETSPERRVRDRICIARGSGSERMLLAFRGDPMSCSSATPQRSSSTAASGTSTLNAETAASRRATRDYWQPKLKRTQERDKLHQRQLREAGWRVFVVWECEICPDRLGELSQQIVSPHAGSDRRC